MFLSLTVFVTTKSGTEAATEWMSLRVWPFRELTRLRAWASTTKNKDKGVLCQYAGAPRWTRVDTLARASEHTWKLAALNILKSVAICGCFWLAWLITLFLLLLSLFLCFLVTLCSNINMQDLLHFYAFVWIRSNLNALSSKHKIQKKNIYNRQTKQLILYSRLYFGVQRGLEGVETWDRPEL